MSSAEFTEWQAFYRLHPFGEWRADARAALIAREVANVLPPSKGRQRVKLTDFMVDWLKTPKTSVPAKQWKTWVESHGG